MPVPEPVDKVDADTCPVSLPLMQASMFDVSELYE